MREKDKIVSAFCNQCRGNRNHDLLFEGSCRPRPDGNTGAREVRWELLQCSGCESIKARASTRYVEANPDGLEICDYPPREERKPPMWAQALPKEIQELQLEVYSAIHCGNLRLALMGTRALLDKAIVEAVGDVGGFTKKLNEMVKRKRLGAENRYILQAALHAGSAATHRGYNPTFEQLEDALNIVEHLLEEVYYFPESAERLQRATPPPKYKNEPGD